MDKGFKQAVIVFYQVLSKDEEGGLPKRYQKVLEKFNGRADLIIAQADKGGRVVVINQSDYIEKTLHLLNNEGTYNKKDTGFAQQKANEFKEKARKTLCIKNKNVEEVLGLVEEVLRPSKM